MRLTQEQKTEIKAEFAELCFCSSEGAFALRGDAVDEISEWFVEYFENIANEKEAQLERAVKKLELVLKDYQKIFKL